MRIRWAILLGATVLLVGAQSAAAKTYVFANNTSPTATEVEGGGYTVSVDLTNITAAQVTIRVASESPRLSNGCTLAISPTKIPEAAQTTVSLNFDPGCSAQDINSVILLAGGSQTVKLTPQNPGPSTPDWNALWAFVVALGGGLLFAAVCAISLTSLDVRRGQRRPETNWGARLWETLTEPLLGLPTTWSLGDSLVTNATVVGSTLAGVVGSTDVVKAIIGTDGDSAVALATVGAAIAAAIVGLAVVVLKICQTKDDLHYTVLGLLLAAAVTISGSYGELFVLLKSGQALSLGGWEHRLWWIVITLGLILTVYVVRSVRDTFRQGLKMAVHEKPRAADRLTAAALSGATKASADDSKPLPADIEGAMRRTITSALQQAHQDGDPLIVRTLTPRKSALL